MRYVAGLISVIMRYVAELICVKVSYAAGLICVIVRYTPGLVFSHTAVSLSCSRSCPLPLPHCRFSHTHIAVFLSLTHTASPFTICPTLLSALPLIPLMTGTPLANYFQSKMGQGGAGGTRKEDRKMAPWS